MVNKNINSGSISTEGGNIHIGDNITYVINDLSILLNDYQKQLKNIEQLLNEFKPKTALSLLEDIEKRINDSQLKNDNITSKILFLKASCKSELREYSTTANEFVQAYLLNKTDQKLKEKACVEYLNLGDEEKSLELTEEILAVDGNNLNAWYVKLLISKDLEKSFFEVPKIVSENYDFQLNIMHWIVKNSKSKFIEDMEKLGLEVNIDFESITKLTFQNKLAWMIALDLLINKIFNDYPMRYIAGKNFVFQNEQIIDDAIDFLDSFINPLVDSEIKDSIYHHCFFRDYFKYYKSKDNGILRSLELNYNNLSETNWFYTMTYCQALNNNSEYIRSLNVVIDYENNGGEKISEFFLFKATLLYLLDAKDKISETFDGYLNTIEIIDERVGFNILNAFFNTLSRSTNKEEFNEISKKVFSKDFKSDELKSLLEITCSIRYYGDFDVDYAHSTLENLSQVSNLDHSYKDLIAENLHNLGKTDEAIKFMQTYVDKNKVSESLRFYIILLEEVLSKNKESGRGIYKELLSLLTFYRLNSKHVNEHFLGIEHNLNMHKNDWEKVREIDFILYSSFPQNEKYLFFYLISLEKLNQLDEILKISNSIPEVFKNESIGIHISKLLLRNNIDKPKGARILYNLASNPSSTNARKFYLGISHLFEEDFFKQYDTVGKDLWVKYSINNKDIGEVKIANKTGIQNELLGKKIGDKFIMQSSLTSDINSIEVLNIYNDELKLHYDIQKEAENPVNELGFASLQIPEKIEDFEQFLIERFGPQQNQEKLIKEKLLNDYYNYRIGYTEVIRSVFRNNPVDAYLHLTSDKEKKFTTIPSLLTKPIGEKTNFVLDFTSLMLFHKIRDEIEFDYSSKFVVSYNLREWVYLLLTEEKNSRSPVVSVQIDMERIKRFIVPENYKENRISFFESLLDWIDKNCEIDLVEEKLDITYQLDEKLNDNDFTMRLMVDNMHLAMRDKYHLISSDSSLYLFLVKSNLQNNIINPEKYYLKFFPEKCDSRFYRYLLKNNYLGVDINFDTLKNEFYALLVGNENYFNRCLENMFYSIHNNPKIVPLSVNFLKEVYLMSSMTLENKNMYSFEIFKSTLYGMPKNIIRLYEKSLKTEFTLLGDYYDEVIHSFDNTKALYRID